MYAIVEIAGHQYKVEKDQQVFVNRLDAEEGKKVKFDRVLLVDARQGDVRIGIEVRVRRVVLPRRFGRASLRARVRVRRQRRRAGVGSDVLAEALRPPPPAAHDGGPRERG